MSVASAPPPQPGASPGIGLEEACARLDVTRETLERLLARFAEALPRALASLSAAVLARDHDAVRLQAHSLSGSAGALSVDGLRWAAAALEAAGRAGQGPLDELLSALEVEAHIVLDSLATMLPPPPPRAGPAPEAARLRALSRCLVAGDPVAITAELAILRDAGGEELERLRALIGEYQYERAAALIAEMT